ncbi:MAG TPA: acetate--CoA ligase family protein, partial [Tepidimicrobium sp.]|nr:acetate--CoA ligase family protein [Tepidimicrobium sp.]
ELGSGAAASHTGSLAGADALYDAAFEQAGILRVDTIEELLDTAKAISMQPLPKGNRIAVLTEAGGPGIISVDEIGLGDTAVLAKFSPKTIDRLKEILPPMAIIDHTDGYVDMSAAADEEQHAEALRIVLEDEGVDGVIHLSVPPTFLIPKEMGKLSAEAIKEYDKPVVVCYLAGDWVQKGREALEREGIPTFDMPDRAAKAMINMVKRRIMLDSMGDEVAKESPKIDKNNIKSIIQGAKEKEINLTEVEARKILSEYGIDFGRYQLANSVEDAVEKAKDIGYPLVMKIMSPDIIHKSDAGGVIVNIKDEGELREAYNKVMENAVEYSEDARINGVLLTPMLPDGREMIIGAIRDQQFGPCVMVGFGGIFVEVLKDVSFKVAPVSQKEAMDMVKKLQLFPVLDGARGQAKLDVDAVVDTIVRVSRLIVENEDIVEIDINPIRVYEKGIAALDARVII